MRHRHFDLFAGCFSELVSVRRAVAMAMVATALSLTMGAREAWAFEAVVVQEKPAIRAGAGPSYYIVGHAKKGEPIEVLRIVHGWYELEPTEAVSLYFEKSQLSVSPDGKTAKTTRAGLTGYLANVDGPGASTWAGPPLEKGAELTILGEEGGYYRVAPPKGTVVYLAPGAVRRMLPEEAAAAAEEGAARAAATSDENAGEEVDNAGAAAEEADEQRSEAAADVVEAAEVGEAEVADLADAADEAEGEQRSSPVVESAEAVAEAGVAAGAAPALPGAVAADAGRPDEAVSPARVTPRRQGPGAAAVEGAVRTSRVGIARATGPGIAVEGRATQAPRTVEDDGVDLGLPEAESPNAVAVTATAYAGEGAVAAAPAEAADAEPESQTAPAADPLAGREDIGAVDPGLRQLEADTLAMLEKPLEQQQLDVLIERFRAFADRTDLSRSDAWIVKARIAQLDRNRQLQKALANLKQARQDAQPAPAEPQAAAAEVVAAEAAPQPTEPKPAPAYSHTGLLVASGVYDGSKLPQLYRLVNPVSKRTVAYVRPGELIEPKRVLGRRVGIVGQVVEDKQLGIGVIEPSRVDVIAP